MKQHQSMCRTLQRRVHSAAAAKAAATAAGRSSPQRLHLLAPQVARQVEDAQRRARGIQRHCSKHEEAGWVAERHEDAVT